MYTQMIIGLARTQMAVNPTMVLIMMSATVDVAELQNAIPGARQIQIDRHVYAVKRLFLTRDITKNENMLEKTARLTVTLDLHCANCSLVSGVPEGRFCDHFLAFCPGKPQTRALMNTLVRWQELGFTRGLEVVPMFSGEDPVTWKYFDEPVSGDAVYDRLMPYYMARDGVSQMRPHNKDGALSYPPEASKSTRRTINDVVKRNQKVGLTTNVNQTGATLTSVAVVISTTGFAHAHPTFVPEKRSTAFRLCP